MLAGRQYGLRITPYDCNGVDIAGLHLESNVDGISVGQGQVDGCSMMVPMSIAQGVKPGTVRLALKKESELVALLKIVVQDEFPDAFRVGPITAHAGTEVKVLISSNDCQRQSAANIRAGGSSSSLIDFGGIRVWGTGTDTCIAVGYVTVDSLTPAGTYQIYLNSNDGVRRWGIDFTVLPDAE
jgi:hypothetical protein